MTETTPGAQCDTCRKFAPGAAFPAGWMVLMAAPGTESALASVFGGGPEIAGTFCSARCLAEHAYVMTATGSGS